MSIPSADSVGWAMRTLRHFAGRGLGNLLVTFRMSGPAITARKKKKNEVESVKRARAGASRVARPTSVFIYERHLDAVVHVDAE